MKLIFCLSLIIISSIARGQDSVTIINDISITGNRTTRKNIILRELTFSSGDTILNSELLSKLNQSRDNLLNTSLFNFVTITDSDTLKNRINIHISVEERWYIWPYGILKYEDRNFSTWLKDGDLSKSKYGFSVNIFNCFGLKKTLRFSFLFGYAKQFRFSYKNIALDKNKKHFLGVAAEISHQDQTIYETINDEPVDYKSSFHSVFQIKRYTLNYTYRPHLYDVHNLFINYISYKTADTIIKLNPDFLLHNHNNMSYLTLDYIFSKDTRDVRAYPLHGAYFEVYFGEAVSLPVTQSTFRSTFIIPSYYKFFEIRRNIFYAFNLSLKLSHSNSYSYFYSRSLGYLYNIHGFDYNTIEGQHFVTFSNLIKFTLLRPRIAELKFVPLSKFNKIYYAAYLNFFADCGYVVNKYHLPENNYPNKFLCSTGAGIDLVTYYDLTFRADYAITGFGKAGLYLSLTAPLNKQ